MAKARTKPPASRARAGPKTASAPEAFVAPNPAPLAPPWDYGIDITESQLEELRLRAGREDYRRVIQALQQNKQITVVPDP